MQALLCCPLYAVSFDVPQAKDDGPADSRRRPCPGTCLRRLARLRQPGVEFDTATTMHDGRSPAPPGRLAQATAKLGAVRRQSAGLSAGAKGASQCAGSQHAGGGVETHDVTMCVRCVSGREECRWNRGGRRRAPVSPARPGRTAGCCLRAPWAPAASIPSSRRLLEG